MGSGTLLIWPMHSQARDRTVIEPWPEPEPDEPIPATAGPVLIQAEYVVPGDPTAFLAAARLAGLSRRRTGATSWGLYQDATDHSLFVEIYAVPTWEEHLRQHHERMTGYDVELDARLRSFDAHAATMADGSDPAAVPESPQIPARHLVAVDFTR